MGKVTHGHLGARNIDQAPNMKPSIARTEPGSTPPKRLYQPGGQRWNLPEAGWTDPGEPSCLACGADFPLFGGRERGGRETTKPTTESTPRRTGHHEYERLTEGLLGADDFPGRTSQPHPSSKSGGSLPHGRWMHRTS